MAKKSIIKNGEIDLIILIKFLLDRKLSIIIITIISAIVSIFIAISLPNEFTVISQLVYKSSNESSNLKFASIASLAGINMEKNNDMSLYLKEIISSNDFLLDIANKDWQIDEKSEYKVNFMDLWNIKKDTTVESDIALRKINIVVLKKLRQKIKYDKDTKSSVISIITTFESPLIAYSINKYVVDKLRDYIKNNIESKSKNNRIFIQKRLTDVKQELIDAENKYMKYNETNVVLSSPRHKLQNSRLFRNVKIKEAIYLEMEKQYELAVIEENSSTPIFEIISQPLIPVEKSKPRRKFIIMLGTLLGSFVGFFLLLLFDWYRVNRNSI